MDNKRRKSKFYKSDDSSSSEELDKSRNFAACNQYARNYNQSVKFIPTMKAPHNKPNKCVEKSIENHIKLLLDKLVIQNKGIDSRKYKEIIQKYLKDINKFKFGKLLLTIAAQSEDLTIIIEYDHDSVRIHSLILYFDFITSMADLWYMTRTFNLDITSNSPQSTQSRSQEGLDTLL